MSDTFTDEQLDHWHEYELIRKTGRWNMFDPNAIAASGLTREEYRFVMKHYSELQRAYLAKLSSHEQPAK